MRWLLSSAILVGGMGGEAQAVTIETVRVGNPGNTGELSGGGPWSDSAPERVCGAVEYVYEIGTYEVTNAQWREFLTARASLGDLYGLYNTDMAGAHGGIDRSGSGKEGDPYVYSAKGGDVAWDNQPVNWVSFWDAARFCNWLHNGQGDGDTESGAYINIGDQDTFTRQSGATYFIPTEDEWYKAAYYDPSGYDPDGPGGVDPGPGYWKYPTQSDGAPTAEAPPGTNTTKGSANYDRVFLGGTPRTTDVGAYVGKPSDSAYGTFDQGGNMAEWNETAFGSERGIRGGDWSDFWWMFTLHSIRGRSNEPTFEDSQRGFRVASIPEPGSITLLVCGLVAGLMWRRRRAA